jgi:hypothetical protein
VGWGFDHPLSSKKNGRSKRRYYTEREFTSRERTIRGVWDRDRSVGMSRHKDAAKRGEDEGEHKAWGGWGVTT